MNVGFQKKKNVVKNLDVDLLAWKAFGEAMLNATANWRLVFSGRVQYSKRNRIDIGDHLQIKKDEKLLDKTKMIKLKNSPKKQGVNASTMNKFNCGSINFNTLCS